VPGKCLFPLPKRFWRNDKTLANFNYADPLMEVVLLDGVAARFP
jgi:hypothetical protein